MIAYKITAPGMVATKGGNDFQLKMGLNETPQANCRRNGFHCAENPLDCLNYYPNPEGNEIYIVSAGGDIDEDDVDSKISCTELTVLQEITIADFVACALLYIKKYPTRKTHARVKTMAAAAQDGFAIAKGKNPRCKGVKVGDVLGFVKQTNDNEVDQLGVIIIDGDKYRPNVWYRIDGTVVMKAYEE